MDSIKPMEHPILNGNMNRILAEYPNMDFNERQRNYFQSVIDYLRKEFSEEYNRGFKEGEKSGFQKAVEVGLTGKAYHDFGE